MIISICSLPFWNRKKSSIYSFIYWRFSW